MWTYMPWSSPISVLQRSGWQDLSNTYNQEWYVKDDKKAQKEQFKCSMSKKKKTKARQKYGTLALSRFYEIQQKCELSCQFRIWFFFSVIFITKSQSRDRVITVPARYGTLALGHSVHTCQDAFIKPLKQQY